MAERGGVVLCKSLCLIISWKIGENLKKNLQEIFMFTCYKKTQSLKSGHLVDYTFVKKDSFNDIIKAKEEAGDNESVKQLKELKNKFFENFKKDLKKKAVKHGVTLKCFEAACAAKHWKETGEDSDGYDFNGFEDCGRLFTGRLCIACHSKLHTEQ